jgi:hypothetical protein
MRVVCGEEVLVNSYCEYVRFGEEEGIGRHVDGYVRVSDES